MSNPDETDIERALHSHVKALAPPWTQKLPGVAFEPAGPHIRVFWMPGQPAPVAFGAGAYHRQRGVLQIEVWYPKSERRVDLALARAKALRQHFYPDNGQGGVITAGAGKIYIDRRPAVSRIDEDTDPAFIIVRVECFARIELPPAS